MPVVILFVATSVVFLIADAIMLRSVLQPLFKQHLGATVIDGFRPLPAALFYVTYMAGVLWFAAWPALRDGTPGMALLNGAILGAVAYGTYELTSWAVMRDWHPAIVATDWAWGTAVTAGSAWAGVAITRAMGFQPA